MPDTVRPRVRRRAFSEMEPLELTRQDLEYMRRELLQPNRYGVSIFREDEDGPEIISATLKDVPLIDEYLERLNEWRRVKLRTPFRPEAAYEQRLQDAAAEAARRIHPGTVIKQTQAVLCELAAEHYVLVAHLESYLLDQGLEALRQKQALPPADPPPQNRLYDFTEEENSEE